ncbi:MAG TPA: BadF/BadG/BcrA/BcrD ATPase family protein [Mycobacteriales bacterium]|nr:BadF/BadG/BcrA/BcrD ATPase family protein [Mycobacteriales bacterium]
MAVYLGVDAGNSKTVALACDESGRVCGCGRSGNGDIYGAASAAAAIDAVAEAIAGTGVHEFSGAAFRLAGIDWPEDHDLWAQVVADRITVSGRVTIANDGFAAIRCGEPSGVGVAIVCGTGPAVAARGPEGREWSASFWIQDNIGANSLGSSALRAVYRAELGIGPPTALSAELVKFFEVSDVGELLHFFTRREDSPHWTAPSRAARTICRLASEGDRVAADLVHAQALAFADYAAVAAAKAGFAPDGEVPVVLAGSVLTAPDSPLAAELVAALPERFRHRPALLPPVAGAALDALAEAGCELDGKVIDTLLRTAPAPEFLRT